MFKLSSQFDEYAYCKYNLNMKTIEQKSERIATRVTPKQKALISRAASLRGRSLTDFMIESAQKEAITAIEEAQVIQLSEEHQYQLAQALMNPPSANQALKEAAKAYDSDNITSR